MILKLASPSGMPMIVRHSRIPVPAPADQHAQAAVTTAKATEGRCLIDDEEVQAQMLPPPLSGVNPPDQELDLSL